MAEEAEADYAAITEVQQQTWSKGDFSRVGSMIVPVAERLAVTADVRAGDRVLDVACGAGNGVIAAARRSWEPAVGLDYVPELLERGRERAAAEGLPIEYVEGDAQELPFEDGSFDVVLSVFGAMFAPDHRRTASEMLRVCRPGGTIGMANWMPEGFVGQMFKTIGAHFPPPPGVEPPPLWGTEGHLENLLGGGVDSIEAERRTFSQSFRSFDHMIDFLRTYFGPMMSAWEQLGDEGFAAMAADLRKVAEGFNVDDRGLLLPSEYLEVVAIRA